MKRARITHFFVAVLVLLALCGPAWAIDGMVSYWRFDEGSGDIAYDSANGNHGTIYGASWTSGIVGGALSFDGVDDYVEVPHHSSIAITDYITIEGWVKLSSLGANIMVSKSYTVDAQGDYTFFTGYTDGELCFAFYNGTVNTNRYYWTSGAGLVVDTWYHTALTYDYYDPASAKIYVNGILQSGSWDTTPTETNPARALPLKIGAGKDTMTQFNGLIDEVAIYNRALTGDEIWDSYVSVKSVDLLKNLAEQIINLNLQNGISNSLDAKLDAALQALDDLNENNDVAAINTLQAFINAVEAQRGNKIPEEAADALIATAQEIIDLLAAG